MNPRREKLSPKAEPCVFPLIQTVHKYYGGATEQGLFESSSSTEALLGVGKIIEWQLSSLGLMQTSSMEDFRRLLGKDFCSFIGSFYAIYIRPALAYKGIMEDADSLVPSTTDSSSSDIELDLKCQSSNDRKLYNVPSWESNTETAPYFSKNPVSDNRTDIALTKYKGDTEISFSRILQLGAVCSSEDSEIAADAPYNGPPVLTMSGLGELGRFGNQVIQYMFMKCCALIHDTSVQIPSWIGESLFCLRDSRVTRKFPAVVESSEMKANSTFTDSFMNYIKASNNGRCVKEVGPEVLLKQERDRDRLMNVDIWGWFQWHTSNYRPFRSYIRSLFRVKPDLKKFLDSEISKKLCSLDESSTLVGIHIRLGDYKDISASSFGYCAPTEWYLEWLETIWPSLKNPVLFVASDEIEKVERDFASYNPKTCRSLGIEMPDSYRDLGADFFPDWYILTQCNVLAISNSTFSFTTCLLNQRQEAKFYRAHYAHRIIEIDPWNTDPVVHRELHGSIWKNLLSTIQMVYRQQGIRATFKNIFLQLPLYGVRSLIMRTVLSLRTKGRGEGLLSASVFGKRKLERKVGSMEHCSKRLRVAE